MYSEIITKAVVKRKVGKMEYIIKTDACMKPYNREKWWIDRKYIKDICVEAPDAEAAIKEWRDEVINDYCVEISAHAIKVKQPMFRDCKDGTTKQVGWVITARTEFQTDDYNKPWVKQFIDLWVEIITIVDTEF